MRTPSYAEKHRTRLKRLKFVQSSETFVDGQGDLFEDTLAADIADIEAQIEAVLPPTEKESTTPPRKKHPGRKPLPPELPREEHRHEPPSRTAVGKSFTPILFAGDGL